MSNFCHSQIVSTQDLNHSAIEALLAHAKIMEHSLAKKEELNLMQGKILAALFYEPSTRTRLSFETAMLRLGGKVINVIGTENSSLKKGESLRDTIKTIENYADIIVMRHPQIGSAQKAAQATSKPFINAGDGSNEHPTQALLDAYTIQKEQGKIDGVTLGFVGDLKYGRTVHSLVYLLSNYDVKFVFISPEQLAIPEETRTFLQKQQIDFIETSNLEKALPDLDVLYVTRIQQERFEDPAEYDRYKGSYLIDKDLVQKGQTNLTIMHALPRVNEIHPEVDSLPNAAYMRQVQNSVPVRMALLDLVSKNC